MTVSLWRAFKGFFCWRDGQFQPDCITFWEHTVKVLWAKRAITFWRVARTKRKAGEQGKKEELMPGRESLLHSKTVQDFKVERELSQHEPGMQGMQKKTFSLKHFIP